MTTTCTSRSTDRHRTRHAALRVLVVLVVPALSGGLVAAQDAPIGARAEALVAAAGMGQARVVTEREPSYFLADFDADGNQDLAVVARLAQKGASRALSKDVQVLNPYLLSVEPKATDVHDTGSDLALFVFHGTGKSWTAGPPSRTFVLLDAVYPEMTIVRRGARGDAKLPAGAKGDGLLTGTEDAKGLIYWDGRTYRWRQYGD